MNRACALWTTSVVGGVALLGCVERELHADLAERGSELRGDANDLLADHAKPSGRQLTWRQALRLLDERNLQLKQGRKSMEDAERRRRQQWKTWLPRVSIYGGLERNLANLGDLSISDATLRAYAPLSIPNPFSERAKAFEMALSVLQSRDQYEMARRQQVVNIYRQFSLYGKLLEQRRGRPAVGEATDVQTQVERIRQDEEWQDAGLQIRSQLARLLDLPGEYPVPVVESLPDISYENRLDGLRPGMNYGSLAMRLYAYQIEGALLNAKGVKFNTYPFFALNGSVPALYDSSEFSNAGDFSGENIRLFASLSKSFSLTGDEARGVRNAEENVEFVRKSVRQRLDSEMAQWTRLCKRYRRVADAKRMMAARVGRATKESAGHASGRLSEIRNMRASLETAKDTMRQMDTEIWLWDDSKW